MAKLLITHKSDNSELPSYITYPISENQSNVDVDPNLLVVPNNGSSWNFLNVPRISLKETTNSFILPVYPDFIPHDFVCSDGNNNPFPCPGRQAPTPTIPRKRRNLSMIPSRRREKDKQDDEHDIDDWTSIPIVNISWPPKPMDPSNKKTIIYKEEDWQLEFGDPDANNNLDLPIMFSGDDKLYYKAQLNEVDHSNYVGMPEEGVEPNEGPVVVSIETKSSKFKDKLRCLVRTPEGTKRLLVPSDLSYPKSIKVYLPELSDIKWTKVKGPEIKQELITMEERSIIQKYKFGVLYAKDTPTENELFNILHKNTSKRYREFLRFLGDKVELQGWQGYRGGLDVKTNTTGTHSIYTKLDDFEIMFHVATLLPLQKSDEQQVERKRHIGNDVVVIVFHEGSKPFDLSSISSQFIRIVIIVEKTQDETSKYKMVVASRVGVSIHAPILPSPPVFEPNDEFKRLLITKCINAERTALRSPDFRIKMNRTNAQILKNIVEKNQNKK